LGGWPCQVLTARLNTFTSGPTWKLRGVQRTGICHTTVLLRSISSAVHPCRRLTGTEEAFFFRAEDGTISLPGSAKLSRSYPGLDSKGTYRNGERLYLFQKGTRLIAQGKLVVCAVCNASEPCSSKRITIKSPQYTRLEGTPYSGGRPAPDGMRLGFKCTDGRKVQHRGMTTRGQRTYRHNVPAS